VIDEQLLATADVVLAMFWTRLGISGVDGSSGTIHELLTARDAGKSVHLLFGEMDIPTSEYKGRADVDRFRRRIRKEGFLDQSFHDHETLRSATDLILFHNSSVRPQADVDSSSLLVERSKSTSVISVSLRRSRVAGEFTIANISDKQLDDVRFVDVKSGDTSAIIFETAAPVTLNPGESISKAAFFPDAIQGAVVVQVAFTAPGEGSTFEAITIPAD
jgi:hypothetical protein